MALMDRLAKFDSALQRGLDNGFAAVFGGRVVPAELEELLKQEAQDCVVANEDDDLAVPMSTPSVCPRRIWRISRGIRICPRTLLASSPASSAT